jgi:mycothiol synthase
LTYQSDPLAPPSDTDYSWRALEESDLAAIGALTQACLAADGGLPQAAAADFVRSRYLGGPPAATLAGFDRDGRLVACAAVQLVDHPAEYRARIAGQVHPVARRRGIGTFLLRWCIAQARVLLESCQHDRPHTIFVATESLSPAADRLYTEHGLVAEFGETVMRRDLGLPLPAVAVPPEIALATWAPERAELFFRAYDASFRDRPGFAGWSAAEWIDWIAGDDDFLPDRSLVALRAEQPVGFIACAEGWIVPVGVRPADRGRGLATALIVEALRRFHAAGTGAVLLDVNVNNPQAERVYARLGFEPIGRRARYAMPA